MSKRDTYGCNYTVDNILELGKDQSVSYEQTLTRIDPVTFQGFTAIKHYSFYK